MPSLAQGSSSWTVHTVSSSAVPSNGSSKTGCHPRAARSGTEPSGGLSGAARDAPDGAVVGATTPEIPKPDATKNAAARRRTWPQPMAFAPHVTVPRHRRSSGWDCRASGGPSVGLVELVQLFELLLDGVVQRHRADVVAELQVLFLDGEGHEPLLDRDLGLDRGVVGDALDGVEEPSDVPERHVPARRTTRDGASHNGRSSIAPGSGTRNPPLRRAPGLALSFFDVIVSRYEERDRNPIPGALRRRPPARDRPHRPGGAAQRDPGRRRRAHLRADRRRR